MLVPKREAVLVEYPVRRGSCLAPSIHFVTNISRGLQCLPKHAHHTPADLRLPPFPSVPNSQGYVVDDARALASLGGAADVAEACSSTSTAPELRLKFRPNDPLSHPLLGTKTNANALVLCIKRKDSHGSGTANNASGVFGAGLAITAVARVTREIKFQNMAEYQHTRAVVSISHPPHAASLIAHTRLTFIFTISGEPGTRGDVRRRRR
jgi:hypothetical protein